jgi:Cys-rich protein (TIGR01571 family)
MYCRLLGLLLHAYYVWPFWYLGLCHAGVSTWWQAISGHVSRGVQTGNRSNIRARYSIRGDTIDDCFKSFVCHCCALTQERREVELEENSF